jgi:hypothetical protein
MNGGYCIVLLDCMVLSWACLVLYADGWLSDDENSSNSSQRKRRCGWPTVTFGAQRGSRLPRSCSVRQAHGLGHHHVQARQCGQCRAKTLTRTGRTERAVSLKRVTRQGRSRAGRNGKVRKKRMKRNVLMWIIFQYIRTFPSFSLVLLFPFFFLFPFTIVISPSSPHYLSRPLNCIVTSGTQGQVRHPHSQEEFSQTAPSPKSLLM